ncbi:enoyl-CoA hydratase/isomerase family protein [Williamsia sp. D3]|uniref:enoyl-CoA hydratase/isomerase family protein n=1 Tax=Williamsia sp. D3 TaxID=1313067 RepID=UPI0003D3A13E|nr:enoyl-CoA hydratase-related protein [Williamsia sp. D3]ETD31383.1 enoyl-CoA hydratase [Williamsia sp. D3]
MTDWEISSQTDVLDIRRAGHVMWLRMKRDKALNAFDAALQDELRSAVDIAAADPNARCVVLGGVGRAFSAGADIDLEGVSPTSVLGPRTEYELRMRYNPIVRALRSMPKPVVAAVNGPAVGVGCSLALACDQVICGRSATFTMAFAKVGLTLDAGASLLLGARVGFGRASRMAFTAESIDAETAKEWAMVDEVVDDDRLEDSVTLLAEKLSQGPTRAFAAIKEGLNTALLPQLDAVFEYEVGAQSRLVDSMDFREGVDAFSNRRRPTFTGL